MEEIELQANQNEEIVKTNNYSFSASNIYRVPIHSTVEQVNDYIESLPNEDDPELFNMHSNANLMYLKAKSGLIIDTILSV